MNIRLTALGPGMLLLVALLSGCAAEPFTRPPLPVLKDPNPQAMRDGFAKSLPNRRLTFDQTVIIQAPFHDELAVLGELVVDRPADTFELVGLDHLGVTLFQIGGDRQGTTIRFAVPPLMEHKDLLIAMGQDIRRMYFDLVPDENAKIKIKSTEVRFSDKTPQGKLVYEFGDEPAVLLEKHVDGIFGDAWRACYYDYTSSGGILYPRGIVMDNSEFHYRIIVKNRAVQ